LNCGFKREFVLQNRQHLLAANRYGQFKKNDTTNEELHIDFIIFANNTNSLRTKENGK
jgi:hypothetical protein